MLSAESGRPSIVDGEHKGIESWQGSSTELSRFANFSNVHPHPRTKPIFEAIANDLKATLLRLDARAIAKPSALDATASSMGRGSRGRQAPMQSDCSLEPTSRQLPPGL